MFNLEYGLVIWDENEGYVLVLDKARYKVDTNMMEGVVRTGIIEDVTVDQEKDRFWGKMVSLKGSRTNISELGKDINKCINIETIDGNVIVELDVDGTYFYAKGGIIRGRTGLEAYESKDNKVKCIIPKVIQTYEKSLDRGIDVWYDDTKKAWMIGNEYGERLDLIGYVLEYYLSGANIYKGSDTDRSEENIYILYWGGIFLISWDIGRNGIKLMYLDDDFKIESFDTISFLEYQIILNSIGTPHKISFHKIMNYARDHYIALKRMSSSRTVESMGLMCQKFEWYLGNRTSYELVTFGGNYLKCENLYDEEKVKVARESLEGFKRWLRGIESRVKGTWIMEVHRQYDELLSSITSFFGYPINIEK